MFEKPVQPRMEVLLVGSTSPLSMRARFAIVSVSLSPDTDTFSNNKAGSFCLRPFQ